MKRTVFLLVSLVFVLAGSLIAQPKLEVQGGNKLDLGSVFAGQKAEQVAIIKNAGNDTLLISDVKAQCGCTATMMTEKRIAPGATGKLSIAFNTTGYNGRAGKEVYVYSNDPTNPKVTINFTANVQTALDVNPKVLTFNDSKVDSTYTRTITISNPSQTESIKILGVDSKLEQLKVTLMKNQLMPGEQTQLQAVLHPTKSGTVSGAIELTTDHKVQPKFDIKVFAWINRK